MKNQHKVFRAAGIWTALLTAVVVATAWSLGAAAERLIEKNAELTAIGYARTISEHVPELAQVLMGRPVSDEVVQELKHMRALGDVFRFKLFGRDGKLLLVSDDLGLPNPFLESQVEGATLGSHHAGGDTVALQVLSGRHHVTLKDGTGKKNRPPLYTEAYVPVSVDGQVLGVVEVYVDSTAQAQGIRAAFITVGLSVAGALLMIGLAGGVQWVRHQREKRQTDTRVHYLARHDPLSGALNRATFNEALEQAALRHEQGGPAFAVHCIDLDRFKEVNDAHGHAGGDAVLRESTRRLQGLVRHGDLLARLGGDEFAILQCDVARADDVQTLGQRIVDALALPYDLAGQRVTCGTSVGAARMGVDAHGIEELLHKADVAMYRAKTNGRGRFSFYDPELDRLLDEKRELVRDLREALAAGAMALHYQALHAADGQTLLGYEALMRWNHPKRGMVPPSTFIPLAENTGQIESLGCWALERSCRDAVLWPAPLTVSVNLSASQFRGERDLVDLVSQALQRSGLPANRLVLEITESLLMNDTESVVTTLTKLSDLGVSIAMDDFGTGYSSLAYLWRFPFHKVKIDRAFTQGLGDDQKVAVIVRSIVTLAHSLGILVNAEGVETESQARLLQAIGCDELQGFLLGRPVPAHTLVHERPVERPPVGPRAATTASATLPGETVAPF